MLHLIFQTQRVLVRIFVLGLHHINHLQMVTV